MVRVKEQDEQSSSGDVAMSRILRAEEANTSVAAIFTDDVRVTHKCAAVPCPTNNSLHNMHWGRGSLWLRKKLITNSNEKRE